MQPVPDQRTTPRARSDAALADPIRQLALLGISLRTEVVENPSGPEITVSFGCPPDVNPLSRDAAIAAVLSSLDQRYRELGGSGLSVVGDRGERLPLRIDTAAMIEADYGVDANLPNSGISEARPRALPCSVVYLDQDSPLKEALLPDEGLTQIKGRYSGWRKVLKSSPRRKKPPMVSEINTVIVARPHPESPLSRITFGGHLRHELAHFHGADEFDARVEERQYLRRQGLNLCSDHAVHFTNYAGKLTRKGDHPPRRFDETEARNRGFVIDRR